MFNFLKRNKKVNPTLKEQIETLFGLGFRFTIDNHAKLIEKLLIQFDRKIYEEQPYILLLTILGAEIIEDNGEVLRMSYDVWNFDTECIDEEGIYIELMKYFTNLSKSEFSLRHVESKVDFDNKEGYISFEYEGDVYKWSIAINEDWLDLNLFRELGKLASRKNGNKNYYFFDDGQSLTLIYCDRNSCRELNKLSGSKFLELV